LFPQNGFVDAEDGGEFRDVFWRGLRLSVEQRCNGDLGPAELLRDRFEG
jgi:hypothetical protein